MTMLEIVIAMPIVLVAISMMFGTMVAATKQKASNQEMAVVAERARALLEELRNEPLSAVFALYNADPFDDPNGPGTAAGNRFAVEGLAIPDDAPNGMVGEIILPAMDVGIEGVPDWQLREDVVLEELDMPRDLTRDNIIDDADHRGDVALLPVLIRIRWQGLHGIRVYELQTILTEYLR